MCKKSIAVILPSVAMQCDAVETTSKVNDDSVTVTLHKTATGSCCTGSWWGSGRHVRFEFPNGVDKDSGKVMSRFKGRIDEGVKEGDEEKETSCRGSSHVEASEKATMNKAALTKLVMESEENRFAQFSKKHRKNLEKILGEQYWGTGISSMPELSTALEQKRSENPENSEFLELVESAKQAMESDPLRVKLVLSRYQPRCKISGLLGGLKDGDRIPVDGEYSFRASEQCVFRQLIDAMEVFNDRKYANYNVWSTFMSELTDSARVDEISEDKHDKKLGANCVDFSDFLFTRIHKECLIEEETESNASAATNKDEKNGHKSRE